MPVQEQSVHLYLCQLCHVLFFGQALHQHLDNNVRSVRLANDRKTNLHFDSALNRKVNSTELVTRYQLNGNKVTSPYSNMLSSKTILISWKPGQITSSQSFKSLTRYKGRNLRQQKSSYSSSCGHVDHEKPIYLPIWSHQMHWPAKVWPNKRKWKFPQT